MKDFMMAGSVAVLLLSLPAMAQEAPEKAVAGNPQEKPAIQAWPGEYGGLKVLNNFVTELLSVAAVSAPTEVFDFLNPRNGWIFISVTGKPTSPLKAVLDDRTEAIVWRVHPQTGAQEAMLFLPQGRHRLDLENAKQLRLDIRTVPEIAYCYYPTNPHIACYGPYDWAYMEKHVLPDVNTLVTRNAVKPEEFQQWAREGRQWVANASLPGLGSAQAPSADEVYEAWAKNSGVTGRGFGGLIVDEFAGSDLMHYGAWSEAVKRLHANPGFAGGTFYAWCGGLFEEPASLEFSRLLVRLGDRFSWEKYMHEQPTPEKARQRISEDLAGDMAKWQKAMPGIERNMVICLGYLSAPPETLNLNPGVDYHVFMDMQFQELATHPAFWGLYGIMEYMADYGDEESVRYAQKLFRHYCIEGRTAPLNTDPYLLPHLENPDFTDGLKGWQAEPAEQGAVDVRKMKGFSFLQGRYPETREGDQFCRMKRSAKQPNRITQTIRALEPGRLYSVKLISADFGQLDKSQQLALSIDITDAEILKEYGFQFVYPSCYSHEVKPYTRDHPAYFNFHRVVFRPKNGTAGLVIRDWATQTEHSGPVGQEIAFNFVEVQPFHAP